MSKDGVWFIYNLSINDKVSYDSQDIIYDVWINSNKTRYIKTGKIMGDKTYFQISRVDGEPFLNEEKIGSIYVNKDIWKLKSWGFKIFFKRIVSFLKNE